MATTYPMTLLGAQKLREELHELKSKVRPRIIKSIAVAREHGDLKENAVKDVYKTLRVNCLVLKLLM
jgi:transcription elongation GreA/GreB family factor